MKRRRLILLHLLIDFDANDFLGAAVLDILTEIAGEQMHRRDEVDQCPFCDAPWGQCMHVQLLLEWETEALVREAEDELGASQSVPDEAPVETDADRVRPRRVAGRSRR